MHAFQTAASAFCIACICAEVTSLLVGAGWAGKCIKAAAGIYILVVLFRLVPDMKLELKSAVKVSPASVSIQSAETSLLQRAREQLEDYLCAECLQRFGIAVKMDIALVQDGQTVRAENVTLSVPPECTDAEKRQIIAYLQEELGTVSVREVQEDTG